MTSSTLRHSRILALDQLAPAVDSCSCFQLKESSWFGYRNPSHHLLLIESGRIEARISEGDIRASAGDLVCFRPTAWNEYATFGPAVLYQASVWFAPPPRHLWTPSFAELGPLPVHVPLGRAFDQMRVLFETLCIEITQPGAVHLLRVRATVHDMLAVIAGTLAREPRGAQALDNWQRLRMRLDAELGAGLSVSAMAKQMNLSVSYFKRAFKQHFGVSPRMYHTRARLHEAMRLLRSTNKPVKVIASELGFSDSSVFTRLFKNQLGLVPSDLRDGKATAEEIAPGSSGRMFPINKYLVPPWQTVEDWVRRYSPPRRRKHHA